MEKLHSQAALVIYSDLLLLLLLLTAVVYSVLTTYNEDFFLQFEDRGFSTLSSHLSCQLFV